MSYERRVCIPTAGRRIGGFCLRHVAALLVTVAASCVLWTVAYLALLLWAIVTDGGLGGPLAYPAGLLFFFLAAIASSLILLFPSTALAEWLARRRAFPILAQIPISTAILALLCLVAAATAAAVGEQTSFDGLPDRFGFLFAAHLFPLGLYWWAVQIGPLLRSLIRRFGELRSPGAGSA